MNFLKKKKEEEKNNSNERRTISFFDKTIIGEVGKKRIVERSRSRGRTCNACVEARNYSIAFWREKDVSRQGGTWRWRDRDTYHLCRKHATVSIARNSFLIISFDPSYGNLYRVGNNPWNSS